MPRKQKKTCARQLYLTQIDFWALDRLLAYGSRHNTSFVLKRLFTAPASGLGASARKGVYMGDGK